MLFLCHRSHVTQWHFDSFAATLPPVMTLLIEEGGRGGNSSEMSKNIVQVLFLTFPNKAFKSALRLYQPIRLLYTLCKHKTDCVDLFFLLFVLLVLLI